MTALPAYKPAAAPAPTAASSASTSASIGHDIELPADPAAKKAAVQTALGNFELTGLGDHSDTAAVVKDHLITEGFLTRDQATADGFHTFGANSQKALIAYQTAHGFTKDQIDGVAGDQTLAKLLFNTDLEYGAKFVKAKGQGATRDVLLKSVDGFQSPAAQAQPANAGGPTLNSVAANAKEKSGEAAPPQGMFSSAWDAVTSFPSNHPYITGAAVVIGGAVVVGGVLIATGGLAAPAILGLGLESGAGLATLETAAIVEASTAVVTAPMVAAGTAVLPELVPAVAAAVPAAAAVVPAAAAVVPAALPTIGSAAASAIPELLPTVASVVPAAVPTVAGTLPAVAETLLPGAVEATGETLSTGASLGTRAAEWVESGRAALSNLAPSARAGLQTAREAGTALLEKSPTAASLADTAASVAEHPVAVQATSLASKAAGFVRAGAEGALQTGKTVLNTGTRLANGEVRGVLWDAATSPWKTFTTASSAVTLFGTAKDTGRVALDVVTFSPVAAVKDTGTLALDLGKSGFKRMNAGLDALSLGQHGLAMLF